MSVVQNIDLPPTLLSRFDLIYLILDKADAHSDRSLAKHLVSLYYDKVHVSAEDKPEVYTAAELADYISYARERCRPRVSDNAVRRLVQGYVEMRQLGNLGGGGKKTITATPRQLESLIRLSEAHAKVHLRPVVEEKDVAEAIRLVHVATQRAAMDPRTGTIDMDAITTGMGAVERMAGEHLQKELKELIMNTYNMNQQVRVGVIHKAIAEQSSVEIDRAQLVKALEGLADENILIYAKKSSTVRIN